MKTLFTLVFSLLFAVASFAQITLTNDSLLAYYSFDNNSNNQHASRFHLSPVFNTGHVGPIYDTGKKGAGVRFNKNNALVNTAELANHLAASQNKSLSLSYWVNYAGTNTTLSTFVELFENLFFRNSNLSYGMVGSNNQWSTNHANANLSGSGWRHIVAIYNAPNSTLQIYLDGNFVRQITVNGTSMMKPTSNFVVGAGTNTTNNVTSYSWSTKGFEGAIDEMYLYNRVLWANEVSDLFNLRVTPSSTVSNEKLIVHYNFENTSNNAHANTHHLTATMPSSNMAAPAFVTGGKVGNAVRFNGSNALWNPTEFGASWAGNDKNLTISTWVRHANNNTTTFFTMFEMFESLFLRTNVSLGISRANAVFNATGGGVIIPANTWTHVTAQYDQQLNQARLYINGDLRATLTGITGFHAYNASFIIGAGTNSGIPNYSQKGFIGDIDEIYVFNRILTPAEIYGMVNLAPVVSLLPKYPVTFSASAGGTLTATVDGVAISSGDRVEVGKTIIFTATPVFGLQISGWFNHGGFMFFLGRVPTVHSVLHVEPGTNRTVTFIRDPAFARVNFSVVGGNGTLTAKYQIMPSMGAAPAMKAKAVNPFVTIQDWDLVPKTSINNVRVTFEATPNQGFKVGTWTENGVVNTSELPVSNTYEVNLYNDINVTVSFVLAQTSVRNTRFEPLGLYPNPARDMVSLTAESNIDKVEIYSLSGALMQTEKGFGARNMNIQLANLNEGLYLVKTYTDEGLQTAKLQVKR